MLLALLLPALAGPLCGTPARLAAHRGRPPASIPVARAAGGACVEPQALANRQDVDGEFTETLATDHVLLAWDPANTAIDETWVQLYADSFDLAWDVQVDQLGWLAPDESETCLLTVLLYDFPDAWGDFGAWTDVLTDGGAPFMVFNTDWQTDGDVWVQTTVYHEFNHASQFAYGVFWEEDDWWYWEATAEWVPDLVDDTANTYTWSLWAYLDAPHLSLESQVGTAAYGHYVFNTHLEETWGADAPREVWDVATTRDHVSMSVDTALGAGAFREALIGMAAHASAGDVAEADVWADTMVEFQVDPYTSHLTSVPAEGSVDGREAPQEGGQGFLHLDGGSLTGDVTLTLTLATDVDGTDPDWSVSLATVDTSGAVTYALYEPDGVQVLTVDDLGGAVADAYVSVTPLGEIGSSGAAWSWSATATAGGSVVDDEDPETVPEETEKAGCACGTGRAPSSMVGVLLGLVALRRRRV